MLTTRTRRELEVPMATPLLHLGLLVDDAGTRDWTQKAGQGRNRER